MKPERMRCCEAVRMRVTGRMGRMVNFLCRNGEKILLAGGRKNCIMRDGELRGWRPWSGPINEIHDYGISISKTY